MLLYSLRLKHHLVFFPNLTYSYAEDGSGKVGWGGGGGGGGQNIFDPPHFKDKSVYQSSTLCLFIFAVTEFKI